MHVSCCTVWSGQTIWDTLLFGDIFKIFNIKKVSSFVLLKQELEVTVSSLAAALIKQTISILVSLLFCIFQNPVSKAFFISTRACQLILWISWRYSKVLLGLHKGLICTQSVVVNLNICLKNMLALNILHLVSHSCLNFSDEYVLTCICIH